MHRAARDSPVETYVLPADDASIAVAAGIIRSGGLVAYPTDTVYGIGAHAFQAEAVEKVFEAKGRAGARAIPLLIADVGQLELVATDIPPLAWRLIDRFWPGALTLVLFRSPAVPDIVSGGGPTVAVRQPGHPVPLALAAAVGAPIAGTSANRSGEPNAVTAGEVMRQISGRIDLLLDGGRCPGGIESTVLDLTRTVPVVIRAGAVPVDDIEAVLGAKLRAD